MHVCLYTQAKDYQRITACTGPGIPSGASRGAPNQDPEDTSQREIAGSDEALQAQHSTRLQDRLWSFAEGLASMCSICSRLSIFSNAFVWAAAQLAKDDDEDGNEEGKKKAKVR